MGHWRKKINIVNALGEMDLGGTRKKNKIKEAPNKIKEGFSLK